MMNKLLSSSSSSLNLIKPFSSLLHRFDSAKFSSTRCSFTSISSKHETPPPPLSKTYHPKKKKEKNDIFEGHEATVYSVCPHHKESIQFIFSTAIDGKIKAWLYDNMGSRVDYDAPGHWCTTMLYSADGSRTIKRTCNGFRNKSTGVVQFDITQNQFLAAGEDGQVKFWDMDNINLLTSTDAEGGLQVELTFLSLLEYSLHFIRHSLYNCMNLFRPFHKGFKILANANGLRSLRTVETPRFEALRSPIESSVVKASGSSAVNVSPVNCKVEKGSPVRPSPILNEVDTTSQNAEKTRTVEDGVDRAKPWQLSEIVDVGVLALGSNGIQKLWKWACSEKNLNGKVMIILLLSLKCIEVAITILHVILNFLF
ncbi:hypothetical protein JHK82_031916 [Glycine max]|nr:hypothetical protein JHK86_032012 [Glycine max]KAG5125179.1 hypothetical protein JHK82_031916 [Glycine max]